MAVVRQGELPPQPQEFLLTINGAQYRLSRMKTYLANTPTWIWLFQPFAQRTTVDLQQPTLLDNHLQAPDDLRPDAIQALQVSIRCVAHQPDQIEVRDHARPQRVQHLEHRVEVVLKQLLFTPAGRLSRFLIHSPIEVDGDGVHMVDRADEEVNPGILGKGLNHLGIGRAYPFGFKADEDLDLVCVFGAQADSFGDVGLVSGKQLSDGVAGFSLSTVSVHWPTYYSKTQYRHNYRLPSMAGQTYALLRDTGLGHECGACAQ